MEWITTPEAWIALVTLTALEIVLGIDNIIFISILTSWLRGKQQKKARIVGLGVAMVGRILLLLTLTWIMRLTTPLFSSTKDKATWLDLSDTRIRACYFVCCGTSC